MPTGIVGRDIHFDTSRVRLNEYYLSVLRQFTLNIRIIQIKVAIIDHSSHNTNFTTGTERKNPWKLNW